MTEEEAKAKARKIAAYMHPNISPDAEIWHGTPITVRLPRDGEGFICTSYAFPLWAAYMHLVEKMEEPDA